MITIPAGSEYDLKTALRGMLIKDNGTTIGKENLW